MKAFRKIVILVVLLGATFIAYQHIQADRAVVAYNQSNLIRFHVVANSDDELDQALKLKVRDVIVEAMTDEFAGIDNIEMARKVTGQDLTYIKELAEQEISANGKKYAVNVCYDRFPFPTRTYDTLTLPAGEYEAVKVVIGEGAGANWWCVLFPPLCFVNTDEEQVPVMQNASVKKVANTGFAGNKTVQVEYRLKIVDLLHEKFSRGGKVEMAPAGRDGHASI